VPDSTKPGFTQVWNALITDHRIGATAFRIASYLGSKTGNFTIQEGHICKTLGIGKDAYRTAMRELVSAGYIARGATHRDERAS
jgi:predicted transcriptional regulator